MVDNSPIRDITYVFISYIMFYFQADENYVQSHHCESLVTEAEVK